MTTPDIPETIAAVYELCELLRSRSRWEEAQQLLSAATEALVKSGREAFFTSGRPEAVAAVMSMLWLTSVDVSPLPASAATAR